ncbi:MAG: helix-turn-helix transcriptional regulator [Planctomycetes bacterium]|nr:helix-turn-helix transcriptional regulator [Planctomycetota bacterium]
MADEIVLDAYDLRPRVRMWEWHPGFAGGTIGPRVPIDFEFVLITQSAGYFVEGEEKTPLLAGDLYLLPPKVSHCLHWGKHGTGHCYIHFDFDLERKERFEGQPVRLAGARPFPLKLRVGMGSPAAKHMLRVAEATRARGPWHRLAWRAGLLELLAILAAGPLRPVHEGGRAGAGISKEQAVRELRVQRALSVLDERLADPQLAVKHLADAARLSEPHFRRLCREVTGRGPLEIMRLRRLRLARQLLLDPGMQVSEVARACGFGDPRYFARLFRRVEGLSPQEFRGSVLSGRNDS